MGRSSRARMNPPREPDPLQEDYDLEDDPDLAELQDPQVEQLHEAPSIGGRPTSSHLFGQSADTVGRASTPPLWAQQAQFPTVRQFQVFKIENGNPFGLGAIDAAAGENEFVRAYHQAMLKVPGVKGHVFKLRPVDSNGKQLGKEIDLNISEHHTELQQIRAEQAAEAATPGQTGWGQGWGPNGWNQQQAPDGTSTAMEEMGRAWETAAETSEQRARQMEAALEQERAMLREQDRQRAEERVKMAENATSTVEKMTERLMETDKARSNEALAAQKEQAQFTLSTMTTVFAQTQQAAQYAAEQQRIRDEERAKQDREFFERQRQETEARRRAEAEDAEARRIRERTEAENKRAAEKEEWERKQAEYRAETERRALAEQRAMEMRIAAEKADLERRLAAEKADLELRREAIRAESERLKLEAEERRRQDEIRRQEAEAAAERRRQAEKLEMEERRHQDEMRRKEAEAAMERRILAERADADRREQMRREEFAREEARRKDELMLQMKQLEFTKERDREASAAERERDKEHQTRMLELARLEREAQREALASREKAEREAREMAEADRQRKHDLMTKEMDLQHTREREYAERVRSQDREHQERILQLTKAQNSGGLSGLTDLLGMDTADVLGKIFGGGGGDGESGGWAEAIPKGLIAAAELAKTLAGAAGGAARPGDDRPKRPKLAATQHRQISVTGPDGVPRMVPGVQHELPNEPYIPNGVMEEAQEVIHPRKPAAQPVPTSPVPSTETSRVVTPEIRQELAAALEKLQAGEKTNPYKRAKEAGISMLDQRAARKGIKELLAKIGEAPPESWQELLLVALAKTPAIAEYLKAVTVYAALAEAKVLPELALQISKALEALPPEFRAALPFDEEEWHALQQKALETEAQAVMSELQSDAAPAASEEK